MREYVCRTLPARQAEISVRRSVRGSETTVSAEGTRTRGINPAVGRINESVMGPTRHDVRFKGYARRSDQRFRDAPA